MAAALQPMHNDAGPNPLYPRAVMNEFDFGDNRYPAMRPQSRSTHSRPGTSDRSWQPTMSSSDSQSYRQGSESPRLPPAWQQTNQADLQYEQQQQPASRHDQQRPSDNFSAANDQLQDQPRTSLSYALPPGAARRVVERYSLDDNAQRAPSRASNETKPPTFAESQSIQETITGRSRPVTPQAARGLSAQGRISPNPSTSLRSTPQNGSFGQSTAPPPASGSQFPPIIPLSASPTYTPPVAQVQRVYAQQPTYVNQPNANNPIQPVYTPIVPQQEEVCVECAMRDQDMADVDVTSPGMWDRASDVVFEDFRRRELEEEAAGIVNDDPSRPRIRGGRLTEQNLKLWLSINPREPASKQQTLNTYIKSQRALLEAEALAHARAMQEAKQLDNRMRDTYSQLRRSAYDMGTATAPVDDLGGVRIKPPTAPATPKTPSHAKSHSREITLLENGMIVEHVDVRKEEREARERRKRDERRARKSSRSSVMDVGSIISQSTGVLVDNSLRPYSRYSQAHSIRPASVLTPSADRPDIPRAYSQASFSDVHSLGSASPRRTRFFGMKNLSAGWRSQDSLAPSGMSGSMVDMHVALQREGYNSNGLKGSPIDLNTPRRSQIWPPVDLNDPNISQIPIQDDRGKKKKGGLAKIWRIVTGKSEGQSREVSVYQGHDDDLPLAPPPPLSYLVERKPPANDFSSNNSGMRHASTPSLPSVASPKFMHGQASPGMSPPTAPSSILPSPASLRRSGDIEVVDGRPSGYNDGLAYNDDTIRQQEDPTFAGKMKKGNWKSMQSLNSEADSRQPSLPSSPMPAAVSNTTSSSANGSLRLSREKSLPPIPTGEAPAQLLPSDRPRTFYGMDSRMQLNSSPDDYAPPQAPFRNGDMRRQSFGGMSSRPNLAVQTLPITKPVDFDSRRTFGPRYDEFGSSRRSLGRLDHIEESSRTMAPLYNSTKRKSKFGFASLLGKKNDKREQQHDFIPQFDLAGPQYSNVGFSPYDLQDDLTTGHGTSTSRHSAFSSGNNQTMRMSMASRKPLEDLVQQDSEFLAYRYPSNDQRLDLLR